MTWKLLQCVQKIPAVKPMATPKPVTLPSFQKGLGFRGLGV